MPRSFAPSSSAPEASPRRTPLVRLGVVPLALALLAAGCAGAETADAPGTSEDEVRASPDDLVLGFATRPDAVFSVRSRRTEADGTFTYGPLYRAAPDGSAPVLLPFPAQTRVRALAVQGSTLAMLDNTGLKSPTHVNVLVGDEAGGPVRVLATEANRARDLRIVGDFAYWATEATWFNGGDLREPARLWRAPLDGSAPAEAIVDALEPWQATHTWPLLVDGRIHLVVAYGPGRYRLVSFDPATPRVLQDDQAIQPVNVGYDGYALAADGSDVYVRDGAGLSKLTRGPDGTTSEVVVPREECGSPLGANLLALADHAIVAVCNLPDGPNEIRTYDLAGRRTAVLGGLGGAWMTWLSDLSVTRTAVFVLDHRLGALRSVPR